MRLGSSTVSAVPPDDAFAALHAAHVSLPVTAHIGVLVPWGNTVVEMELPRLGLERVIFHYARLVPARRYRDADNFLNEIAAAVPSTLRQFDRIRLAGALVACTSTGFLRPGAYVDTPVIDAFEAILCMLAHLGASRVALATPYPTRHTAKQVEALRARGIDVTGHASLDLGLLDDFAGVTTSHIRDLVARIPPAQLQAAQALVLSCTAWPTIASILALQATLGLPVVSSNLALAYNAIQIGQTTEVR